MGVEITRGKQDITNDIVDDIDLENKEASKKPSTSNEAKVEIASSLIKKEKMDSTETKIIDKKAVSYKFGIIGCGHAGSRLAEVFYGLGYQAIALNTATQDLAYINIPEENKLFMDIGIQGAAKDLTRGEEAAEAYREKIQGLIYDKLGASQILIVCSSTAGGSGAGSLSTIIEMLQAIGKPIIILAVLPMVSEDAQAKSNALETVSKLGKFVKEGKAHNLILVDNARIEAIHCGVGQMEFYKVANKSVVEPLHTMNLYSTRPSDVKPIDSAEFATLLLNGEGLSIYGQMTVTDYEEDVAISAAVMNGLQENLLASGFDLKQAKMIGIFMIANKSVWSKIPAGQVDFAMA